MSSAPKPSAAPGPYSANGPYAKGGPGARPGKPGQPGPLGQSGQLGPGKRIAPPSARFAQGPKASKFRVRTSAPVNDASRPGARTLGAAGVRVVYEDQDMIVVEKPAGLLTAGSPGETRETLHDLVRRYTQGPKPTLTRQRSRELRESSRPTRVQVGVIHRLDREASGLLVFSLSERSYHWLKDDFKAKRVHRIYTVLVEGEVGAVGTMGTVQSMLLEGADGRVSSIAPDAFRGSSLQAQTPASMLPRRRPGMDAGPGLAGGPGGAGGSAGGSEHEDVARPAVTHYRVIGVGKGLSLLQVRLETGRKHQIRVHLSERGHPVVGDERYGATRTPSPVGRLALHASELGFSHPGTGQTRRFSADAPAAFFRAVGMEPSARAPEEASAPAPVMVSPTGGPKDPRDTSWDKVATWYDELISERRNDHYEEVIVPGVMRLMNPAPGQRVLDVACGQGVLARRLASIGCEVVGIDSAHGLIEAAKRRAKEAATAASGTPTSTAPTSFHVVDARELGGLVGLGSMGLDESSFDSAACVMALANIEPLLPAVQGVARLLKPGGKFVWVITHPAFRAIGQTSWDWDLKARRQFRRVEGYLSPGQKAIQMHPGAAPDITTWTFHRPMQTYVRTMVECGLLVEGMEEWAGQRVSQAGPRADEENRARREIPLFWAVRCVKPA